MAEGACSECGAEVIGPLTLDVVAGGDSGAILCTGCGRVDLRADPDEIAERWRQGER
jgi:hypothetical protein